MNNIKNIIFDFGGVLYDIDVNLSIQAFSNLGINTKPWQNGQEEIFNQMEIGAVSEKEIMDYFIKIAPPNTNLQKLIQAFNAILIGINLKSLEYLVKLKQNYNLILLSNTNKIHFDKFSNEILSDPKTSIFYKCFNKEYYSYKLKMRKPQPGIFKFILNDSQIKAEESLFVDDTKENLIPAQKLGIHTFWMQNIDNWDLLIEDYSLKI